MDRLNRLSPEDSSSSFKAVVISLKRSSDRLAAFRQRFGDAAESITVVSGVDGELLDADRLHQLGVIDASALDWPQGQLGCALSHLRCLLHCLRTNRCLVIFEDDAIPAPDWSQELARLVAEASAHWDLLLLGWNLDSCLQLEWGAGVSMTGLFQPRFPNEDQLRCALAGPGVRRWFALRKALGLAGYVVSPAGAARILEWALPLRTLPIQTPDLPDRPCFSLDGQLNCLYPELSAWVCVPPLVLGANHKPSSLTSE